MRNGVVGTGAVVVALAGALVLVVPGAPVARACGGFFCGQQPVDQQAERIVFAMGETGTTMIVQIAYAGRPDEFAWVLPIAGVPDRESLGTFPAAAIQALDVNTAPMFFRPDDPECGGVLLDGGGGPESTPGVTVHIAQTVGPYDVAVVEAETADPLFAWLDEHGYRLGERMRPVVATYVDEGMNLLALRLSPDAETRDIEPFRMTLPPGPPSIPIRLTAIASEPEMGLLVFLLGDGRWGPANWSELEIDPASLRYASYTWPAETDWLVRVARDADEEGGRAWVTEMAGPTAPLRDQVSAAMPADGEQAEARDALLDLLGAHPYLTRLYARLSPDEMTLDPVFRPHGGPDVVRERMLARTVDGVDQCRREPPSPCEFVTCGRDATCVGVQTTALAREELPACSCGAGTSARATIDPRNQVVPICQATESFLSPAEIGIDACTAADCGLGDCVAINGTPTCACDEGAVAIAWALDDERVVRCVDRDEVVPGELIGQPVGLPAPPPPPPPEAPPPPPGATGVDPGEPTGYARGGGGCSVIVPGARPSPCLSPHCGERGRASTGRGESARPGSLSPNGQTVGERALALGAAVVMVQAVRKRRRARGGAGADRPGA